MKTLNKKYEKLLRDQNVNYVAGIDEAGRGSWAGPVVAACVIFDEKIKTPTGIYINDSKKLTARARARSYQWLIDNFYYGVGVVSNQLIDTIGIVPATHLAMEQAIMGIKQKPTYLLIDAVRLTRVSIPQVSIIKGDGKVWSIAAASIIAKVTRDQIMDGYHKIFPAYNFDKHKGYGTASHYKNLCLHGTCPIHRRSYAPVRKIVAGDNS